ncbi:hypothetical protein DINM_000975 [Dirofilaria immitis]|nr:hypothetical protein [Dirofilaria immitis]
MSTSTFSSQNARSQQCAVVALREKRHIKVERKVDEKFSYEKSKIFATTKMEGSPDALLGTETIAQLAISNPVKTEEPIGLREVCRKLAVENNDVIPQRDMAFSAVKIHNKKVQEDQLLSLVGIILRARQTRYVVMVDVEKAFLQVDLYQHDKDVTRFLWLGDIRKETTARYLLNNETSVISEEVARNIYIDNIVLAVKSMEEELEGRMKQIDCLQKPKGT